MYRHKTEFITPDVLWALGIRCYTYHHKAGEFVIVTPCTYHAGVNLGANVAEATALWTRRWVDYAKYCTVCKCEGKQWMRLNLDSIIQRTHYLKYADWKSGKNSSTYREWSL